MQPPADQKPSVTQVVDTVSGFPEISYWRDSFLANHANVSDEDKAYLTKVQFSNSSSFDNLEKLFDVESGDPNNKAPPSTSLFNLTQLKTLLRLGESTPNIFDKDVSYA